MTPAKRRLEDMTDEEFAAERAVLARAWREAVSRRAGLTRLEAKMAVLDAEQRRRDGPGLITRAP